MPYFDESWGNQSQLEKWANPIETQDVTANPAEVVSEKVQIKEIEKERVGHFCERAFFVKKGGKFAGFSVQNIGDRSYVLLCRAAKSVEDSLLKEMAREVRKYLSRKGDGIYSNFHKFSIERKEFPEINIDNF